MASEMVPNSEFVRFPCGDCKKPLKASLHIAGQRAVCPHCKTQMLVPVPGEAILSVLPVPQPTPTPASADDQSVPMEIALPHNLGKIKAVTSRRDSSNMLYAFVGGALALAGVVLCALLGIRQNRT